MRVLRFEGAEIDRVENCLGWVDAFFLRLTSLGFLEHGIFALVTLLQLIHSFLHLALISRQIILHFPVVKYALRTVEVFFISRKLLRDAIESSPPLPLLLQIVQILIFEMLLQLGHASKVSNFAVYAI